MSYQKDPLLGKKIHQALIDAQVETPMNKDIFNIQESTRINNLSQDIESLLNKVGFDLKNDSMKESPLRIAKMFIQETFSGLNYDNFPSCNTTPNDIGYRNLIITDNIPFNSTCEHHLQTIIGTVSIAYVPNEKILGLSKFNRLVRFFSQRPQLQERLTQQLYVALSVILNTSEIAVYIKANHNCVSCRGIKDRDTVTKTFAFNKNGAVLSSNSEETRQFLLSVK